MVFSYETTHKLPCISPLFEKNQTEVFFSVKKKNKRATALCFLNNVIIYLNFCDTITYTQ